VQPSTALAPADFGSPLRRGRRGWSVVLLLLALDALAVLSLASRVADVSGPALGVLVAALLATTLLSVPAVAILRWLDRRAPNPWFVYALAFVGGGLLATLVAGDISALLFPWLGNWLGNVLAAPVVEEAAKALGLLALVLALRADFDNPRDGFVYGALVGLGFEWLEATIYLVQQYQTIGETIWVYQLVSRYALLGFGGQALFTGLAGTLLGFALIQRGRRRQIEFATFGYLLATLTHMAWNSLGVVGTAIFGGLLLLASSGGDPAALDIPAARLPVLVVWLATVLATLLVNLPAYVIVLVGLRRAEGWERHALRDELVDEVGTPTITAAEYALLERRPEPPRARLPRLLFRAQCRLARRKALRRGQGQPVDADPLVVAWRTELTDLRRALPPPEPVPT
jgi:RsiW-degrading membrane proteinase PrsW (M82 family)